MAEHPTWMLRHSTNSALQQRQEILPAGKLEHGDIVFACVRIFRLNASISLPG